MKNTKGYKIYNFIMKIISWCVMSILVVVGALLLTIVVLNKIAESKGEPSPMGLYTIISPSMTPDIQVYDVVFVVRKDPKEIEVGDIVSYYSNLSTIDSSIPVTHRVVEKFNTNSGVSFRTKGDANSAVDNEIVMGESVVGTVRLVIPLLGRIQFFLASKGGWFIAILFPAVGIVIYDIIKLIKLVRVRNKMSPTEKSDIKTNKRINLENKNEIYRENKYKEKFNDDYNYNHKDYTNDDVIRKEKTYSDFVREERYKEKNDYNKNDFKQKDEEENKEHDYEDIINDYFNKINDDYYKDYDFGDIKRDNNKRINGKSSKK